MEEITLEKIDILRQRSDLSYAEAKEILEKNNGNVLEALIYLENNEKTFSQNINDFGNDLIKTIKDIVQKGNVNRIKIKKDGRTLVDIPVTAAVAAGTLTLFYPAVLAIGTVAAVASKITIEIEKSDGTVEVVNQIVKDKVCQMKDMAKDVTEDIQNKAEDIKNDINGESEKF